MAQDDQNKTVPHTPDAVAPTQTARADDLVILHDYFAIRGGGERLVLTMAQAFESATLVFGYRTEQSFDGDAFPEKSIDLSIPSHLRRFKLHLFSLCAGFALWRDRAARFRRRIFSGVAAPFAAPPKGAGVNIFYCHTPPRFLYDKRDYFQSRFPAALKPLIALVLKVFAHLYRMTVDRMDLIITNSENTRARIQTYLGRDSVVVYPPCDVARFQWLGQGDYYLSTARLTGLKRVDLIVDAFIAMPDKKLVVASGGEELERLRQRAANAPNIRFAGWTSDDQLLELIGNAIATIYVPMDEDFGMSPVESMAAGKPVIGVAEGGLVETIVDGKTGTLLPSGFGPQEIVETVIALTPQRALDMRDACEARAALFDEAAFVAGMRKCVADLSPR